MNIYYCIACEKNGILSYHNDKNYPYCDYLLVAFIIILL